MKNKTSRQRNAALLITSIVILAILNVASYFIEIAVNKIFINLNLELDSLRLITMLIIGLLLFSTLTLWGIRNHLIKYGFKGAIKHWKLVKQIRRQLIKANIYDDDKTSKSSIIFLPKITIDFSKDFDYGKINILNSIKLNKQLSNLDISPSLNEYVVEQSYLSDDRNNYIYEIYNSKKNRQLTFNSIEHFNNYSSKTDTYKLFIDESTIINTSHYLITGQTGTGKTYALYSLILQSLTKSKSYDLYFADPKDSSLAKIGEKININQTASQIEDIIFLISEVYCKMNKRKNELKSKLDKKLDSDYSDFNMSPIILIIDEYASFKGVLNTKDKKTRDNVESQLQSIVLMGRQLGCFLWIVMQKSDATTLPTQLRDNLIFKVVLGNAESTTYITTFGPSVNNLIPHKKMRQGEGIYTYPQIANYPKLLFFPKLNFDINLAIEKIK